MKNNQAIWLSIRAVIQLDYSLSHVCLFVYASTKVERHLYVNSSLLSGVLRHYIKKVNIYLREKNHY